MMADTEDKVEGTETQETVETKAGLEDSTHESQNEDAGRKSTISRIAEILAGKKPADAGVRNDEPETEEAEPETVEQEEVVETEAEPEEVVDDTDDKYSEIDPQFVKVARAYGWDDNHIVEYAESHDDRDLVLLTSMMEKQARPVEPSDVVNNEEKKDESPYSGILKELEANEAVGGPVKQLLKSLVNELKETKAQLNEVTTAQKDVVATRNRDEWFGRLQTADESFDDAAKEFPELGNSKTLKKYPDGTLNPNDGAVQARELLFKMAVTLHNSGSTWNTAVKDALRWYKGGREDVVEAKVLRKIKDNAKRITPKRDVRHQTKKYANEIEEKAAVVNDALRKHGIELSP